MLNILNRAFFILQSKNEGTVYEMNEAHLSSWSSTFGTLKNQFKHIPLLKDSAPGRAPIIALVVYVFCALGVAALALVGVNHLIALEWWAILIAILLIVVGLTSVFIMFAHVQNKSFETFKVGYHCIHVPRVGISFWIHDNSFQGVSIPN